MICWFLLPNGQLDEIDVIDHHPASMRQIAEQSKSRFWIERGTYDLETGTWGWLCYEADRDPVSWASKKNTLLKTIRAPSIDAAVMYLIAKGATS